jgi:DNA invertase Pin-like site-specific DNA recombinase
VIRYAKTIAYLRVSTAEQDLEKDKSSILELANDKDLGKVIFVQEKISGTVPWKKRKIPGIIDELDKGDNLIVSELSRIGRSMLEIMQVLSIALEKGINVYAVKGNWQLDQSIQSKIVAVVFSMAAEIERELISRRTKEALNALKARNVKLGRPKGPGKSKLDQYRPEIEALLLNGSKQKFIANRYRTTESNLSNWIKKNKINAEIPLTHIVK